ncbi:MAG TPA: hypothetical protein VNY08_25275 [Bradyrhizobium sp.]|jgi:hypothetical protein|nr:hypothetical protein [Bradyrhizobium sp.]
MRNLILISAAALLLASASAQAGQSRGLVLAAADTPAATTSDTPAPLPPVTQNNEAPKPQAADTAKPRPSRARIQARSYQSDEAKARRIAARYGISW